MQLLSTLTVSTGWMILTRHNCQASSTACLKPPFSINCDKREEISSCERSSSQLRRFSSHYLCMPPRRPGALTEWYVNGPLGLEQGFTLSKHPSGADGTRGLHAGTKPLILALSLSGDLTPAVDQSGLGLTLTGDKGQPELRYGGLSASDASGKQLRAWMEIQDGDLLLKVDDAGAR